MKKQKAEKLFKDARCYMLENNRTELLWIKKDRRFIDITPRQFLEMYCWVVYASNFKVDILEEKFPKIRKAFKNFSIKKIGNMRSVQPVLSVFNNGQKANCFLRGTQKIYREGFSSFKNRVKKEGIESLTDLPGIGEVTKKHLARNVRLADVAKDDIHIQRLVNFLNARNERDLAGYLSKKFREKKGVIDAVLWRFCADRGRKEQGYESLRQYLETI